MRKWVAGDKSIEEAYARKTAREHAKRTDLPKPEPVVKKVKVEVKKVKKIPKSIVSKVLKKIKDKPKKRRW